jgi:hypothetical protein
VEVDRWVYVRVGQDIYRVRRSGKMLEELDARKQGNDNENSRGDLHFYISVCDNIKLPRKEADYPRTHSQLMVAA